ncbi:MAG: pyridoxal-dependent decarboxylase [Saprospiraceae bacterium]|nr:pyridoxal-dependent decarboxylase [Saprospiraceae bacterium]
MIERIKALEAISKSLEPDLDTRQQWLSSWTGYLHEFIDEINDQPAYIKGKVTRLKSLRITDEPKPISTLLDLFKEEINHFGLNPASGGHLGYIPGGGIFASSLGDMMAAVSNRYAGIFFSNPGAVIMENQLIRWMCEVMGYPATAHGNITSGGSIANLIAMVSARDYYQLDRHRIHQAVIYTTEQVHHCVHKSVRIAGLAECVARTVPMDQMYRMDTVVLERMILEDIEAGLKPFMLIGSAGTTDTGAVDPLDNMADLAEKYKIWFHIDAAYGGFFNLLEQFKPVLKGIERSDSLAIDPHKGLFLPYGTGAALFKNTQAVLNVHHYRANYMKDAFDTESEELNPCDLSPELTKHFRGPRMWVPLHLHGLACFKAALEEKILLCRYFYKKVQQLGFQVGPYPMLSITIFRYVPPFEDTNTFNNRLVEALHEDGRVFFSSTIIDGQVWIRCAILGFRTHISTIDKGIKMLQEVLDKLIH